VASYTLIFAFDKPQLIGMGRALCDGEYQAAIYDMVVLPEYQGQGVGREMLRRLCTQLPVDNIILYAVPGREGFYQKCGFTRMRTAMAKLNPFMSDPVSGYLESQLLERRDSE
jgi:ribosomal protein S18 acetylase RimI-like enzyme